MELIAGLLIGAAVGCFTMSLVSVGGYNRGFADGKDEGYREGYNEALNQETG